jgi:hypothetical protein
LLANLGPEPAEVRVILTFTSSPDDEEDPVMARPRALPPGIRPRGHGYVYDWRDASDKT